MCPDDREIAHVVRMNPSAQETSMLRDVLASHNRMTEQCFDRCCTTFRQMKLTDEEKSCIDSCTGRYVAFNQRLMAIFFEQQQGRIQAAVAAQGQTTAATTDTASKS